MKNTFTSTLMFFTSLAFGQITDVSKVQTFRDIEHKIKGCPINSICDEKRGKLISDFEQILKVPSSKMRFQQLKKFSQKNGLPLKVLTSKELGKKDNVVLWNSRCKSHNPKNPNDTIYEGYYFSKQIPLDSNLHFDDVYLFDKGEAKKFTVPYQDKPLFLKGNRLHFLKDYDDQLFQLSLNQKGEYRVENLDFNVFKKAQSKKIKEVPCPDNKKPKSEFHTETYCQKIWDIDTNKLKTVQVYWSCP